MTRYSDELACDMAETYHIYNVAEHTPFYIARLVFGLRANSRVKMKINNMRYSEDQLIQALIVDRLSMILWSRSEDARKGKNRPKSLFDKMNGPQNKLVPKSRFKSLEEFNEEADKTRERIMKKWQN